MLSSNKLYTCDFWKIIQANLYDFKCDLTNIANMAEHQKIHPSGKSYECEFGNKTFSQRSDLTRHERVHTGEKPCEICKKDFSRDSSLAEHKRVHTVEKPYECEICKKTFSQKSALTSHKRVHTGEKPYSCEICKKNFNQYSNLKGFIQVKSPINVKSIKRHSVKELT